DMKARQAIFNDFRHGAKGPGNYRRPASHRLDHHQSKRLRPVDWEKKCLGAGKEGGLFGLVDFADELHKRIVEQWADLGLEVVSVGLVDLRGDLQRNTGPLGDFDRSIRALVVTDAAQEGEVIALAVWMEAMQPCGQAMIDGREPVGGGQG